MPRSKKEEATVEAEMPDAAMLAELAKAGQEESASLVPYDAAQATMAERNTQNQEYWDLVKRTVCKGATDIEFKLFMNQCVRTGLDPLSKQIYAIFRWDGTVQRKVMGIQVSIDGYRIMAERSKKYRGQEGPLFCSRKGDDWMDVWVPRDGETFPFAAKVGVMRSDFDKTLWAVAPFMEYVQRDKDDCLTGLWAKMPGLMLAKAAESLALRKAFPQDLSGLHTTEEMEEEVEVAPRTAILPNVEVQRLPPVSEAASGIALLVDPANEYENKLETELAQRDAKVIVAETVDAEFEAEVVEPQPEPVIVEPKPKATRSKKAAEPVAEAPVQLWTQKTKGDSTPLDRASLRDALTEVGVNSRSEMLDLLEVASWNDIPDDTTFGFIYNQIRDDFRGAR